MSVADNYEQRVKDMDNFMKESTCYIPEFDNDLVRRLIASIKVVSAEKLIIQFQSGIVMEQEIRYEENINTGRNNTEKIECKRGFLPVK